MAENPLELVNPIAALVAGFLVSLHCMGMCGPLTCVMLGSKSQSRAVTLGGYHLGKLFSYATLGGIAGAIGAPLVSSLNTPPAYLLTGSMALFFLLMALGMDRYLIKVPLLIRFNRVLTRQALRINSGFRGIAMGALTPLIPCGPLYLIIWVASVAGTPSSGATMLAFFGLGTVPGLLASQLGWTILSARISPVRVSQWRRGLTFAACAALILRSLADLNIESLASRAGLCH